MRKRERAKLKRLKQQNKKMRRSLAVVKVMCAYAICNLRKRYSRLYTVEDYGLVFRKKAEEFIEKRGAAAYAEGGKALFGKY